MEPLRFPTDSPIVDILGESAILVGGGRALLMQAAHPMVAQGVYDHSNFAADPIKRLLGTLEASYSVVFGSVALGDAVGRQIGGIHRRVTGPGYAANDPGLLLWVHATLYDTARTLYEWLVHSLDDAEREALYLSMREVAVVFGCPLDSQPPTAAAFDKWFTDTIDNLEPSAVSKEIADSVLHLALPWYLRPLLPVGRFVSVGLLPPAIRDRYGYAWSQRSERRLQHLGRVLRTVYRFTPSVVRRAPAKVLTKRAARRFR